MQEALDNMLRELGTQRLNATTIAQSCDDPEIKRKIELAGKKTFSRIFRDGFHTQRSNLSSCSIFRMSYSIPDGRNGYSKSKIFCEFSTWSAVFSTWRHHCRSQASQFRRSSGSLVTMTMTMMMTMMTMTLIWLKCADMLCCCCCKGVCWCHRPNCDREVYGAWFCRPTSQPVHGNRGFHTYSNSINRFGNW